MFNTSAYKRLLLPAIALLVLVGAYFRGDPSSTLTLGKQCTLDGLTACNLAAGEQRVSVQLLEPIVLEEETLLLVTVPEGFTINTMWVQGVNMYMGRTPIMVDKQFIKDGHIYYNATFFLGSCSEPNMKWQLIIQGHQENIATDSWFFNFNTGRSI
jgi:hypothetical protein